MKLGSNKQGLKDELDSRGIDYPENASSSDLKQLLKKTPEEANESEQTKVNPDEVTSTPEQAVDIEGNARPTNPTVNTGHEKFDPNVDVQSYGVSDPNRVNDGSQEYDPLLEIGHKHPEKAEQV